MIFWLLSVHGMILLFYDFWVVWPCWYDQHDILKQTVYLLSLVLVLLNKIFFHFSSHVLKFGLKPTVRYLRSRSYYFLFKVKLSRSFIRWVHFECFVIFLFSVHYMTLLFYYWWVVLLRVYNRNATRKQTP